MCVGGGVEVCVSCLMFSRRVVYTLRRKIHIFSRYLVTHTPIFVKSFAKDMCPVSDILFKYLHNTHNHFLIEHFHIVVYLHRVPLSIVLALFATGR